MTTNESPPRPPNRTPPGGHRPAAGGYGIVTRAVGILGFIVPVATGVFDTSGTTDIEST
jgi:hypothetical protein